MSVFGLASLLLAASPLAAAEVSAPPKRLWAELDARRQEIVSLHQEFEATRTFSRRNGPSHSSKWRVVVDLWPGRWRETTASGDIRFFDGQAVVVTEEGGDEYVRTPHRPKDAPPQPTAYDFASADWTKVEAPKPPAPCGLPGPDRPCVTLQAPLKRWVRGGRDAGDTISLLKGAHRVVLDAQTGMLVTAQVLELIDDGQGGYTSDLRLTLKRWSQGAPMDPSLFTAAVSGLREVKDLSPWNAARIEKRLIGKPAPELTVTDIRGQPLTLSSFKGRFVLLDFWATWCPPCQADAPALEKLHRRYGDTDLVVIGIAVGERRDVIASYREQKSLSYPVILASENDLPRVYRVDVIPAYIVIDKEGAITAATEGDKGLGGLRRLLKKAGLETDD